MSGLSGGKTHDVSDFAGMVEAMGSIFLHKPEYGNISAQPPYIN